MAIPRRLISTGGRPMEDLDLHTEWKLLNALPEGSVLIGVTFATDKIDVTYECGRTIGVTALSYAVLGGPDEGYIE